MVDQPTPNQLAEPLSDAAITLCLGWFMFGAKATVNISPPHANLHQNKGALDELVEAGLITHSYEERRDIHSYKGTTEARSIAASDQAKKLMLSIVEGMD